MNADLEPGTPAVDPRRLRRLLQHLIDQYSPSGKEEEICAYLRGYLRRHGLPAEFQAVDEARSNVVVLPPEGEPRVVFVGHVDTVTAPDLQHFEFEEDGDLVTGLGAADMKGGCAAMVEAFVALAEAGRTNLPVALALVVGEEETGDGARSLVEEIRCPWAVIGEPTGLVPCTGSFGYLEAHVTAAGRRRHASMAEAAGHPVAALMRVVLGIGTHLETARAGTVFNVRDLHTASSGFAVPERCEAWLDLHLPPTAPIGQVVQELEDLVAEEGARSPDAGLAIRFETLAAGYELADRGLVVDALRRVFVRRGLAWSPRPFPSHSDANLLWAAGVRPIIVGCGDLEQAHSRDESVSWQQVVTAAGVFLDLALEIGAAGEDG
jgi:acetylornithine deacetylase